jgi:hypothetical protein
MQSKKERQTTGREKLLRVIETCKSIEQRSLDPFLMDIDRSINIAKEYLPEWEIPEDLCLDAETIHSLASVIKLQSEWVRHRSTSLYTDPFLLQEKLVRLEKAEIIETFLTAWHPIVAMEQISLHSLAEAMRYWDSLLPIKERWKDFSPEEIETGLATREELINLKILREQAFSEELERFWQELKEEVQDNAERKIHYWDFVGADTYEETADRAFMTSFLVTYGYATLEIHPLEEEMFIQPNEKPETRITKKQLISIPISISMQDWQKWKRGEV